MRSHIADHPFAFLLVIALTVEIIYLAVTQRRR
jgi:hypothetical protein